MVHGSCIRPRYSVLPAANACTIAVRTREARGTHGAAVQFVLTTRQSPQSYMQQHKPLRERTGFVIHETVGAERDGGRPSPAASPRRGPILPTSSSPSACRSGLARLLGRYTSSAA